MMKQKIFLLALPLLLAVSCSKPQKSAPPVRRESPAPETHAWYYLDANGFHRIEKIQRAPAVVVRPWTEALRISDAGCAADDGSGIPPAYALVNRGGVIGFNDDSCSYYPDTQFFSSSTAQNLAFEKNTPVFSLYRSTFFNTAAGDGSVHPFLVQFAPQSHLTVPIVNTDNLGLGPESEITDYVWDGTCWVCSVKTETKEKTAFSYISWQPQVPLLSLTPATAQQQLSITQSSKDKFRTLKTPQPFAAAPARLKKLLASLPASLAFQIECATAGGHSPRPYIHQQDDDTTVPMTAHACIADTWICALFEDGTGYISGALYGQPIMNGGKTTAFRLPKLPDGYTYGAFAVSGQTLYAAWEEASFYKTGRSGFLSVNLAAVLEEGA